MQELRLVAVSEDGTYCVLAVPGRGGRFVLPIDDRLRTVARGQFSRLAQYEIEVENPLRPKEIQDRIRAGETAEEIADAAGIPIDRVRRFEGPVLAEREYRAQEAQRSTVRGHTESGPGPRLGEIVTERLTDAGASADTLAWDSRKRADGNWQVQLQFTMDHRPQLAEWVFDPRRRHVIPADDLARRLCLPQADWPAGRLGSLGAPTATVTPIGSRLGAHHADSRAEPRAEPDRTMARGAHAAPAAASTHAPWSREAREPGWARETPPAAPPVPAARAPEPDRAPAPVPAAQAPGPEYASNDYFSTDYISPPAPAAGPARAGGAAPAEATEATATSADGPGAARPPGAAASTSRPPAAGAGPGHQASRPPASTSPASAQQAAASAEAGRSAAAAPEAAEAPGPADAGQAAAAGQADAGEGGKATASEAPRPAEPAAAEPPARPGRKSGRGRRASVPSWDEIMLGNSRQPD
ncbi:MAG TPA: septation protein SepH [Streptosporangiaceae bacterium]|jgi:hypothetical protein